MRRQAQLLARYRMLHMQDLRGNVDTRLRKVQHGEVDGAILAAVGLIRLGLAQHITEILPLDLMLPAVGQGALAVETRAGDWVDELLAPLHHAPTAYAITAERAFLTHLGGGCMVPIAALGECQHDVLHLQGLVSTPQGDRMLRHQVQGPAHHAEALGQRLAAQLLEAGADEILQGG
jgi:hydroxymethylbilane synthase